MTPITRGSALGEELAKRLGLTILRTEGHELVGPCIACRSSEAFRLHRHFGLARCDSCHAKWSPFQLAETIMGNREQVLGLMQELGRSPPLPEKTDALLEAPDPVAIIAGQCGLNAESLRAYGATADSAKRVRIPAYGQIGSRCTTFMLSVDNGKGLFEKAKPAGLFFPHLNGHTEGTIIVTLIEKAQLLKGRGLVIEGVLPPCSNCSRIMKAASTEFLISITYMDRNGSTWNWLNGVFVGH